MQIQGTGEIGSTKRKFHLTGVPLIESRLYFFVQALKHKMFGFDPFKQNNDLLILYFTILSRHRNVKFNSLILK